MVNSESFLAAQLDRMSGMRFFPANSRGAKLELIRVMRSCDTEGQVAELVSRAVSNAPECPTPAELGDELRRMRVLAQVPHECERCKGTRFVIVKDQSGIERAARCPQCSTQRRKAKAS